MTSVRAEAQSPAAQPPVPGQSPAGALTVDIKPVGTVPTDPGGGVWFYSLIAPGQSVRFTAELANSAEVPQTVRAYLADLIVSDEGSPRIGTDNVGVGAWGAFDEGLVTIPPRSRARASFTVKAPDSADPGDH